MDRLPHLKTLYFGILWPKKYTYLLEYIHMKTKPSPIPFARMTGTLAGLLLTGLLALLSTRVLAAALPPVAYLPLVSSSTGQLALPPADAASNRISVPAGFAIRIYSAVGGTPRLMEIGPDGELYVALMGAGQIVRLPDRNHDGLSDGTEIVLSGLTQPHNMEWHNTWLYVAQTDKIQRFDAATYARDTGFQINLPTGGHSTRTLHFGPDGKLYVAVGSSCNVCDESGPDTGASYDPRRAAILRFNDDGSIPNDNPFKNDPDANLRPVWAWGLRNSVDFTWTPAGQMWADHNGSDGLGDNLPPEELIIPVQGNKSHGWPYCYTPVVGLNDPPTADVRDTRISLPTGFTCAQDVPALLTVPAHSAPLGMGWGPADIWPADYRDDMFVALHGSWNTTDPANYRDCKVTRVLVQNGQVLGSQDFANGWREPGQLCGSSATYGRPADVVTNAQGEMFISDDKGQRIYRVIYTGN